jgi:release factor glutamine methyltransferase
MGTEARARQARRASELIEQGVRALQAAGIETPRLDAELLLAEAAGVARIAIVARAGALEAAASDRYVAMIARRARREPLAYILGRKEFYSLELAVTPAVLIPRPETETIVDAALAWLASRGAARVLDLGTGSGAIAIAIARNAPGVSVVAADLSREALAVAQHNVERHNLADRIALCRADCFDGIDAKAVGPFDLIVSNPPYIAEGEMAALQPEVARHEPRLALAAGPDGLSFYRRIAARVANYLNPDGRAIVELGEGQADRVAALFAEAGFSRKSFRLDLAGTRRALLVTS